MAADAIDKPDCQHRRPSRAGGGRVSKTEAHGLADRLPDLVLDAMRISSTVAHGIHGRRRAGPGETFWQFRQFGDLDAATLIDWRRSASSDHLFVREREWEAAHTVWLWPDLSPSMHFNSHLSPTTKRDRAVVLTLAAAELLVRGGERVGLLGLTRADRQPQSRRPPRRSAAAINASAPELTASLPPEARLPRFSGAILISDFLDPRRGRSPSACAPLPAPASAAISCRCSTRPRKRCPMKAAPSSSGLEGGERWIADRAESLRERYQAKLAAHRDELIDGCRRLGWTLPRPSHRSPGLRAAALAGHAAAGPGRRLSHDRGADGCGAHRSRQPAEAHPMSFGALAFLSPWLLTALAALPVIYWLLRTVPPRPRQIAVPGDPHPRRHRQQGEDAGQDAVVADADPHARRRLRDLGAGRARAQSEPREGAEGRRARSSSSSTTAGRRPPASTIACASSIA